MISWRILAATALLAFGLQASLRLTVWGLLVQLAAVFCLVFVVALSIGQPLVESVVVAYAGIFFVQVGYFLGLSLRPI
jgi:hypothetical protein